MRPAGPRDGPRREAAAGTLSLDLPPPELSKHTSPRHPVGGTGPQRPEPRRTPPRPWGGRTAGHPSRRAGGFLLKKKHAHPVTWPCTPGRSPRGNEHVSTRNLFTAAVSHRRHVREPPPGGQCWRHRGPAAQRQTDRWGTTPQCLCAAPPPGGTDPRGAPLRDRGRPAARSPQQGTHTGPLGAQAALGHDCVSLHALDETFALVFKMPPRGRWVPGPLSFLTAAHNPTPASKSTV